MVDEALDAVLETKDTDIARENDLNAIIKCWNRLFTKDSPITKYKYIRLVYPSILQQKFHKNCTKHNHMTQSQ